MGASIATTLWQWSGAPNFTTCVDFHVWKKVCLLRHLFNKRKQWPKPVSFLKLFLTGGCCPHIFGQPSDLHRIAHFWRKCGSPFTNQKKRWYLGMNGQRLWLAIAGQMFWWKGKLSNQCVAIDLYLCNIFIHTTFHWVVSMLSPFPKILVVTGKGDNPI